MKGIDKMDRFSFEDINMDLNESEINCDRKLFVAETRPQIKDLDNLPIPDRSLIDYGKYSEFIGISMVKNAIVIQATRGCPYMCAYCHKIWPKTHVVRSAEHIFNEVKLYYDMGYRRFAFIDDIFNLDSKNSSRFFKMVIDNGLKIHIFFPNGIRGDILNKEYIDLMVEAGVVEVPLALETASPRLQKLIGKNLIIEKLNENARYIAEKYPHVILELFTIHGIPTETEEEANMTLEFIKSIKWLHFPYVNILRLYPNTELAEIAMKNGVTLEQIENAIPLAFHEIPDTLPFTKGFTRSYQSKVLYEYILNKERLLKVIPFQRRILTEDELVQKYDSYLPIKIGSFNELLNIAGIKKDELDTTGFIDDDFATVVDPTSKMKKIFGTKEENPQALRILFLDLSQFFNSENSSKLYDMVETPLGHMYLLTYLYNKLGTGVYGKIAKSRIDFDSYEELKLLLEEFKPDVIGLRTLTYHKDFFHNVTSLIRQWGYDVPMIAGGPYATSSYETLLKDKNVDLAILGEGEETLLEVIEKIIANNKKLPDNESLKKIKGIAFEY